MFETLAIVLFLGMCVFAPWKMLKVVVSWFLILLPCVLGGIFYATQFAIEAYQNDFHCWISMLIAGLCWFGVYMWCRLIRQPS